MEKYEIKIVNRSRITGKEIIGIVPENIARVIYGDELINIAIATGIVKSLLAEEKNAGK